MACAGDERFCDWDATFLTHVTGLTRVIFPQTHLRSFLPHVPLRCHLLTCLCSCSATFSDHGWRPSWFQMPR